MVASSSIKHCVGARRRCPSSHKTEVVRTDHIVHLGVKQYGNSSRRTNLRRQRMPNKLSIVSISAGLVKRIGSQKTVQDYQNKESIFAQGDAADAVFFIDHGNVKL